MAVKTKSFGGQKTAHSRHIEKQVEEQNQREARANKQVNDIKTAIKVLIIVEKCADEKGEPSEHFLLSLEDLEPWLGRWQWEEADAQLQIQKLLKEKPTSRWHL